jgi:hypothetical protein
MPVYGTPVQPSASSGNVWAVGLGQNKLYSLVPVHPVSDGEQPELVDGLNVSAPAGQLHVPESRIAVPPSICAQDQEAPASVAMQSHVVTALAAEAIRVQPTHCLVPSRVGQGAESSLSGHDAAPVTVMKAPLSA